MIEQILRRNKVEVVISDDKTWLCEESVQELSNAILSFLSEGEIIRDEEIDNIYFECGELNKPSLSYLNERLLQAQLAKDNARFQLEKQRVYREIGELTCNLLGNLMPEDKEIGKLVADKMTPLIKYLQENAGITFKKQVEQKG